MDAPLARGDGGDAALTRGSAVGGIFAPASEEPAELLLHRGGEVLGHEPAGQPDRLAHLREVFGAVRAAREVALEAAALAARERALEVVADQLDDLLADDVAL